MTPHLPLDMARCQPRTCRCDQATGCARATDWPTGDHIELQVVDSSIVLQQQSWCQMFIDRRGMQLRAAQQAVPA